MNKTRIKLDKHLLANLIGRPLEEDDEEVIVDTTGYKVVQETIDSIDEYDGGADYSVIIERLSDNKFFKFRYQEWDVDWEKNQNGNFPTDLWEVKQKQVTSFVYE